LLVSGCTRTTKVMLGRRPDRFGVLLTPGNGNREWWDETVTLGVDNEWFRDMPEAEKRANFLRLLAKLQRHKHPPAWVSAPDCVGDAAETLRRFGAWEPLLRELGLSVALVSQDGLRPEQVPWDRIACLFVGGSTEWKLCDASLALTLEARGRGKLVHFGRVNTDLRITFIASRMKEGLCWCDTFDGTGFSAFGDKRMPKAVRWTDRALAAGLFDEEAA
jgi:hypothetical protein